MMIDQTKEGLLTRDMVSPALCRELYTHYDVVVATPYQWRLFPDGYRLWTYYFDPCKLYTDTDRALWMNFPEAKPKEILSAYTISHMEQVIPGYLITKAQGTYEVGMDADYNLFEKDLRLADAFAKLVMACLRNRIMDNHYVINKIIGK